MTPSILPTPMVSTLVVFARAAKPSPRVDDLEALDKLLKARQRTFTEPGFGDHSLTVGPTHLETNAT